MSAGGFPGALGVVRIQLSGGTFVALLPALVSEARSAAQRLVTRIGRVGDTPSLIPVGADRWVRAREVVSVEVVPTEDPGASS